MMKQVYIAINAEHEGIAKIGVSDGPRTRMGELDREYGGVWSVYRVYATKVATLVEADVIRQATSANMHAGFEAASTRSVSREIFRASPSALESMVFAAMGRLKGFGDSALVSTVEAALKPKATCAPATVDAYRSAMMRFLAWCYGAGVSEITRIHVTEYLAEALTRPATRNVHLTGLRILDAYRISMGCASITEGVKACTIAPAPSPPESYSEDSVSRLLDFYPCSESSFRDMAVVRLMTDTGLSASKMCNLVRTDFGPDFRWVEVTRKLAGRGRPVLKDVFWLSDQTMDALEDYSVSRSSRTSPCFFTSCQNKRLTRQGIWLSVKRRHVSAGLHGNTASFSVLIKNYGKGQREILCRNASVLFSEWLRETGRPISAKPIGLTR